MGRLDKQLATPTKPWRAKMAAMRKKKKHLKAAKK